MKTFSDILNESVITVPAFYHPDLGSLRDADGKFWMAITNANDTPDKIDKAHIETIIKKSKELYSLVASLGGEYASLAQPIHDIVKKLKSDIKGQVQIGASPNEIKQLQNYLICLAAIDGDFSTKQWYPTSKVAIKYGYVPFRGSAKDAKIKYRMVVRTMDPLSDSAVQVIKRVKNLNPLTQDYIAGIEFNKDHTAFQILFSSNPGYKR